MIFARRTGRESGAVDAPAAANSIEGRPTTRRGFLKYGAAGLTTVAAGAAAGAGRSPFESTARAAGSHTVQLLIAEGDVRMIDGAPVFMRGFGRVDNNGFGRQGPRVPGPPIGPAGDVNNGEVPFVTEDDIVSVTIENTLDEPHRFLIRHPLTNAVIADSGPISRGTPVTFTFTAPSAGTYFYTDAREVAPGVVGIDAIQTLLGMHGVMVVMPKDGRSRPYSPRPGLPEPPEFASQYVWVLHDIDSVWGELARQRRPIVLETFLPRYFTINGVSGLASIKNPKTQPHCHVDQKALIRIVNMGAATHSCHFHGNHAFVLDFNHSSETVSDGGAPIAALKDVVMMPTLSTKDVLLPCQFPGDAWPRPVGPFEFDYPMHCHAEMSQTAAGGNYPSGMLAEWVLVS